MRLVTWECSLETATGPCARGCEVGPRRVVLTGLGGGRMHAKGGQLSSGL